MSPRLPLLPSTSIGDNALPTKVARLQLSVAASQLFVKAVKLFFHIPPLLPSYPRAHTNTNSNPPLSSHLAKPSNLQLQSPAASVEPHILVELAGHWYVYSAWRTLLFQSPPQQASCLLTRRQPL
ncbi:hypothetical protein E4U19_005095 [Claviceps sp. Clav32 group G5]|nr:hypothetical protein E4U19_005095 [Claviceps sp. Clav32 group G5]